MSLTDLIANYGYLVVLLGSLLEGETVLVLAGFAAHQGHLSLPAVMLAAFVGGSAGDQIFFWIGRRWGPLLMRMFPGLHCRTRRVGELLQRHDRALIVGIRFIYGLRIAGPIAMGTFGVAPWRFALFNLLGAAIWAPAVCGFGYVFGEALQTVLGNLRRFEDTVLLLIVAAVILFTLVRRTLKTRAELLRGRVKVPPP